MNHIKRTIRHYWTLETLGGSRYEGSWDTEAEAQAFLDSLAPGSPTMTVEQKSDVLWVLDLG